MGIGDNILATGMARGAAARGKRIAFGDGRKILWDANSKLIFRRNPNIAHPASVGADDLEWIPFYKGHRIYNRSEGGRWIWNYDFRAVPGEIFFLFAELQHAKTAGKHFVVIEPNVPVFKHVAPNKQWPVDRYDEVARKLAALGHEVVQFNYGGRHQIAGARQIPTPNFRYALAALARAKLYIGPEGGLHHGAAAVATPAVVLFGGFIPPAVTGYDAHVNLTGGAEACGMQTPCEHCRAAMAKISVDEVLAAADGYLMKDVA
jgi:ADP-heptose:LPS heptosyltransferase